MIVHDMYEEARTRANTNVDITICGGNEGVKMDVRRYQGVQNKG